MFWELLVDQLRLFVTVGAHAGRAQDLCEARCIL